MSGDWDLPPEGRLLARERDLLVESNENFEFSDLKIGEVTHFRSYIGESDEQAVQRLRQLANTSLQESGISMGIRVGGIGVLMRRLRDGAKGRLSDWLDLPKGSAMIFDPYGITSYGDQTELARRIARFLEHKGHGKFKVFHYCFTHLCVRRLR